MTYDYKEYIIVNCCYCKFYTLMYHFYLLYLKLYFTVTIPRSYTEVEKSLSESTTILLIVLSDSDDASETCTIVKNTNGNVKLEEVVLLIQNSGL